MAATHVRPRSAFPDARHYPRSRSAEVPEPGHGREDAEQLAKVLGWFSIGLGIAALAAPRGLARAIGIRGDRTDRALLQAIGVQELVCGVGILSTRRPAGWVWARVAGDALHLSLATGALATGEAEPDRMAATAAALAGIAAVDAYNAVQLSQRSNPEEGSWVGGAVEVHQSITISRPADELYRFWRDFTNLPRVMSHLESVRAEGDGRSHWKARGPAGLSVEWDAEVTEDRPNESIAWQSVGGHVDNGGCVRFVPAPGGRGTEVHVALRYDPPGGPLGRLFAKLFGEAPEQQVFDDLRRFKQVMETGEVVLSGASGDGSHIAQRPAQPPEVAGRR